MRLKQNGKMGQDIHIVARSNWPCNIVLVLSQGHLFCLSLYFRTYTHTCANMKTCAMIGDYFFPSTIKNVPLFDHSHAQTCTKVNKALKHVG